MSVWVIFYPYFIRFAFFLTKQGNFYTSTFRFSKKGLFIWRLI